jgi:hypothetical protein
VNPSTEIHDKVMIRLGFGTSGKKMNIYIYIYIYIYTTFSSQGGAGLVCGY